MKLGFALPHVGPVADRDNIHRLAIEAERLDYSSLWTLDRVIRVREAKTAYPGTPDGQLPDQYDTVFEHLSVLTYVAAITERVRLGVSVLNLPFYQPVLLAKRVATLDRLSGGRLDLGVAIGWSEDEYQVTGIPFRERVKRTEEYIAALKALWGPDPVEFRGDFVDVPPASFGPKPVQDPHPPLYMGAHVPAAVRRGARLADGLTACCAPVETILGMRRELQAAADEAGRDGATMPTVVRCLVELDETPLPDGERPVGSGTWDQLRADVERLAEGGVEETFFDVSFQPGNATAETLFDYLGRLRGILD